MKKLPEAVRKANKRASDKAYNEANKEKIAQKRKEYYEKNRDLILAKKRENITKIRRLIMLSAKNGETKILDGGKKVVRHGTKEILASHQNDP